MSYKSEHEAYARCIEVHGKWQMAAFLLLDELNQRGIDMRWVVDATKGEITREMLHRQAIRGFVVRGEEINDGDGI